MFFSQTNDQKPRLKYPEDDRWLTENSCDRSQLEPGVRVDRSGSEDTHQMFKIKIYKSYFLKGQV